MDKGQLLRKITADEDERLTLARLLDQWERAQRRNIPASTPFLSPREQSLGRALLEQLGAAEDGVAFAGGYEGAERRVALFLPDYLAAEDYASDAEYPICAVRCTFREEDQPTHRDFLGSLMGLGLRRNVLGDLLITAGNCDILLRREMLPFVLQNYTGAGRTHLKVAEVPLGNLHLPEQKRREIRDTVATLRLDSVLSSAFRISRTRAAELIRAGRVEINWQPCEKADRLCAQGDVLTARGLGKCTLAEVGGLSKKGRVTIRLERYQ